MSDKDQTNENDAYQRAAEFLRRIDARRGQVVFPQPLGVKTTETSSKLPPLGDAPRGQIGGNSPGGGTGGADNLEEVTGAVNGVASTLQVQTDGNGWTAV